MEKFLKISMCDSCPFLFKFEYQRREDEYVCLKNNNNKIDNIETIPGWCPLPDVGETK